MKTLFASIKITLAFCVILFVGYVLVLWGFAWIVKPNHGEAELLKANGAVVGVSNVGQQFTQTQYFWGRPSAVDYNGGGSGGSNQGATNPEYLKEVEVRIDTFLVQHPYLSKKMLLSELVTSSGSGLDPHISPEAAAVQIRRVAVARGLSEEQVSDIVASKINRPLVGKPYINVLELNIALDINNK